MVKNIKIDQFLRVTMPDASKWDVPVKVIAEHRAMYYFKERNEFGSFEESYNGDTIPLFESDPFSIKDWATNNMNWEYVKNVAKKVEDFIMTDKYFQKGWVNGYKEIVEGAKDADRHR